MTENTYHKYKRALHLIAQGADDPRALAAAALTNPKAKPTYTWKRYAEERKARAQIVRDERRKYCAELYGEWVEAGQPPLAKFARTKGKSHSSVERALHQHERREFWPKSGPLARASADRAHKRNEMARLRWEEQNKDEMIRVRYFDREESAEALAAELGWTPEQMQAFIEAARMDRWVTTTEYNLHLAERAKKFREQK